MTHEHISRSIQFNVVHGVVVWALSKNELTTIFSEITVTVPNELSRNMIIKKKLKSLVFLSYRNIFHSIFSIRFGFSFRWLLFFIHPAWFTFDRDTKLEKWNKQKTMKSLPESFDSNKIMIISVYDNFNKIFH